MTCGIYAITSPTGRRYVGQSRYIEMRFEYHRTGLMQGKHHCVALQHEWNSSKPDKLKDWHWTILVQVPSDTDDCRLDELEAFFINNHDGDGVFNTVGVDDDLPRS